MSMKGEIAYRTVPGSADAARRASAICQNVGIPSAASADGRKAVSRPAGSEAAMLPPVGMAAAATATAAAAATPARSFTRGGVGRCGPSKVRLRTHASAKNISARVRPCRSRWRRTVS
ncbi:hypothetical protein Vretimale_5339 [Volvox reticuliferus]|uniref:Uncharacterized protein n=1 Tax=Volvox reticuliferus TaxID=1737510 RepID=A0A8J4G559_9CHLO|nr:hypothetical protein Vretimale_5339 [Volvox reticuliferus]